MTQVKVFYDQPTFTLTYVVYDEVTKDAIVFDPLLDYDPAASTFSSESVEEVQHFIKEQGLKVHYVIETHAHADHLTGARELIDRNPGAKIVIGSGITAVQDTFKVSTTIKLGR
ncbi:MAG: MBL fold metallo-hydrolase [Bdellovibrionales bacterium]